MDANISQPLDITTSPPAPVQVAPPVAAEPVKAKGKRGAKGPRVEPMLTGVSSAVVMPTRNNTRGTPSIYPFDKLTTVGMSFGVTNKTLLQMGSIVSNANRKALVPKTNDEGKTIYKTKELVDQAGVKTIVMTDEPELVAGKHFFAIATVAKKDPDNATVRVFRDK